MGKFILKAFWGGLSLWFLIREANRDEFIHWLLFWGYYCQEYWKGELPCGGYG